DNSLNQALTLTLLGTCGRKVCSRPRARNPRTGAIHDYCSLRCAQQAKYLPYQEGSDTRSWESCDSSMELLIALEMSRLQMIEDEARRRLSWLQEHSREHHWEASATAHNTQDVPAGLGEGAGGLNHLEVSGGGSNLSRNSGLGEASALPLDGASSYFSSRHELPMEFYLKELVNKEINVRNLNVKIDWEKKTDKELLHFPKSPPATRDEDEGAQMEDGHFQYGDLHENGHLLIPASLDLRRDLRRSQSLGDLKTDDSDPMIDSDHVHNDHPEEMARLRLANPKQESLDITSESGTTDPGAASEIIGDMDSPMTDLEVRGILSHLNGPLDNTEKGNSLAIPGTSKSQEQEPSFQLVIDEGTDKDESNSTEQSTGSQTPSKNKNLRIHISNSSKLETQSSNEYESETGIPNSPTLYISGVSISRSPEPRSPK
ncbi:unnamed protein product, partial [Meganyctiphanes norvegica]